MPRRGPEPENQYTLGPCSFDVVLGCRVGCQRGVGSGGLGEGGGWGGVGGEDKLQKKNIEDKKHVSKK